MEESLELRAAIENLYTTFAAYPLRADTNACVCCHRPYDEERVHQKALRKLSVDDLRQYATDALLVWGDDSDFKHFLPRIFELEVAHDDALVDPQVVLSKLAWGEWRYWPEPEQRSIEQFLKALWDCVINQEPHPLCGLEMDDWLCAIAQAESDLSPYLAKWLIAKNTNARLNLAAFIADTSFARPNARAGGYWGSRFPLFDDVARWVRSDAVKSKVAEIAAQYPQYEFVERAYTFLC